MSSGPILINWFWSFQRSFGVLTYKEHWFFYQVTWFINMRTRSPPPTYIKSNLQQMNPRKSNQIYIKLISLLRLIPLIHPPIISPNFPDPPPIISYSGPPKQSSSFSFWCLSGTYFWLGWVSVRGTSWAGRLNEE